MQKYFLLLVLSLIWGSQFMFMALITQDANPFFISFIKALLGALFLTALTLIFKRKNYQAQWGLYVFIAMFEVVFPFVFIAFGQKFVSSGVSAVIMALVPVFTLIIMFFATSKKLKIYEIVAVFLGFVGVVFISWNPQNFNIQMLLGLISLLLAAFSFAISLVLMQRLKSPTPILHMRNVLGIASVVLFIIVLILPQGFDFHFDEIQWSSLIILGVVHSAIAYVIYNILARQHGALFASFSNYLVPIIGLLLGFLFLNETIGFISFIGILIVFISLFISQQYNEK
ncbi:DMT family transporter [Staphylococcus auricularis]|uniref:DMT family transporter n=1 Tax=Staphylococcus auricularis TaxID=29379 RepID=UPI00243129BF|nr:DMT family transporter [Staphylococcus auricularis]